MKWATVKLHSRDEVAHASSFWSRDDAKFVVAAPFLVGAALLWPKARWHPAARLIEAASNPAYQNGHPSAAATIVCERLDIDQERLRKLIALSRVNQTEHLIHVIYSLLRKDWRPRFEISGRRHLDEAIANGKGVVIWVAHFSFASLFTKMALSEAGYKISHISRPEHGVSKSRFGVRYLNWFRCVAENRHLDRRIVHLRHRPEATKEAALATLRRNELLSITVGAWEGRRLATGGLLGLNYTVSTGAPGFAFATGARLLPVFTTRDDNSDHYHVVVGAPLGESARTSREDFVRAATGELFSRHETAIRKAPDQWRGWYKLTPKLWIDAYV